MKSSNNLDSVPRAYVNPMHARWKSPYKWLKDVVLCMTIGLTSIVEGQLGLMKKAATGTRGLYWNARTEAASSPQSDWNLRV